MPTYGPWVQPPDQWVEGSCARTSVYWARNLGWFPDAEGIGTQAAFDAVQAARVRAFFEASSPDWLALVDSDSWESAATSEEFAASSPAARLTIDGTYSPGSSVTNFVNGGWATMTGSIEESTGPVVGPSEPLLPNQEVEFESEVGSYSATERQFRMRSTYASAGLLSDRAVMWTPGSAPSAGSYPWTGRAYAAWNEAPATAQSTLHAVTTAASSIIAMPVFKSWFNEESVAAVQTGLYRLFRNAANNSDEAPTYWVLYTPPRYRIITLSSGQWLSQQRHNPQGNAGGWPSQQRHAARASGGWASQHRRTAR